MNKTPSEAVELAKMLKAKVDTDKSDVVFCVPAIDIIPVGEVIKGTNIALGAENVYFEDKGAYTGEISAPMLKDAGVKYVIVGHSERRQYFGETDEDVNKKIKKILEYGMTPIMCCGETLEQREMDITIEHIRMQIKKGLYGLTAEDAEKVVIAYEPIWAIGTGKSADQTIAENCCKLVRDTVKALYDENTAEEVRIQYGGSVKPTNIKEYMACEDIDGALIGGASLKVDSFIEIIDATRD